MIYVTYWHFKSLKLMLKQGREKEMLQKAWKQYQARFYPYEQKLLLQPHEPSDNMHNLYQKL